MIRASFNSISNILYTQEFHHALAQIHKRLTWLFVAGNTQIFHSLFNMLSNSSNWMWIESIKIWLYVYTNVQVITTNINTWSKMYVFVLMVCEKGTRAKCRTFKLSMSILIGLQEWTTIIPWNQTKFPWDLTNFALSHGIM